MTSHDELAASMKAAAKIHAVTVELASDVAAKPSVSGFSALSAALDLLSDHVLAASIAANALVIETGNNQALPTVRTPHH